MRPCARALIAVLVALGLSGWSPALGAEADPASQKTAAQNPAFQETVLVDSGEPAPVGPASMELDALTAAAETGDVDSQVYLSLLYYNGEGIEKDLAAAARWAETAADQGSVTGARTVGAFYYNGIGVGQDYGKALQYFRQAADGGSADAQYGLGLIFKKGQGVMRAPAQAEKWFAAAAAQGHLDSQFQLGLTYFLRRPADYEQAEHWYRIAANRKHPSAQTNLGALYLGGLGVEKDANTAYMWFTLAAASGHEKAWKYLEIARSRLDGAQREEAEARARAWTPDQAIAAAQ